MSRHRVKTPKSQGLKALAAASQVNFSVMDVWTPGPCGGGRPVITGHQAASLVVTHLMPAGSSPLIVTIKNVSRLCQMSPRGQNHLEMRTSGLNKCLYKYRVGS